MSYSSIKVYVSGNLVLDGFFQYQGGVITRFSNTLAPCKDCLLPPNTFENNDNVFTGGNLSFNGLGLSSVPSLDVSGTNVYNLYYDSGAGTYTLDHEYQSGFNTIPVTSVVFASMLTIPPLQTFKPKAMSYTEYLRSKTSVETKVLNTRPKMDASDFTQRKRLGASTVFANNGQRVGVINTSMELTQDPLKAVNSYKKGAGGRVGDASSFTAFRGSQAIGGLVQAGLPPDRIVQIPSVMIESSPVSQTASDFVRNAQGCKVALGQPHQAATVGPALFVDNTVRNQGDPGLCTTRAANHIHPADVPHNPNHARPILPNKGNLAPGKEVAAFGGNAHYKPGAMLRRPQNYQIFKKDTNIGTTSAKPVPTKYQIPANSPAHLKINDPTQVML